MYWFNNIINCPFYFSVFLNPTKVINWTKCQHRICNKYYFSPIFSPKYVILNSSCGMYYSTLAPFVYMCKRYNLFFFSRLQYCRHIHLFYVAPHFFVSEFTIMSCLTQCIVSLSCFCDPVCSHYKKNRLPDRSYCSPHTSYT